MALESSAGVRVGKETAVFCYTTCSAPCLSKLSTCIPLIKKVLNVKLKIHVTTLIFFVISGLRRTSQCFRISLCWGSSQLPSPSTRAEYSTS